MSKSGQNYVLCETIFNLSQANHRCKYALVWQLLYKNILYKACMSAEIQLTCFVWFFSQFDDQSPQVSVVYQYINGDTLCFNNAHLRG